MATVIEKESDTVKPIFNAVHAIRGERMQKNGVDEFLYLCNELLLVLDGVKNATNGSHASYCSKGTLPIIIVNSYLRETLVSTHQLFSQLQSVGTDVILEVGHYFFKSSHKLLGVNVRHHFEINAEQIL